MGLSDAHSLRRPFRRRHGIALGGGRGGTRRRLRRRYSHGDDRSQMASFMRSYPNFIPLSARTVAHIGTALAPFAFETIYGHYFDRVIDKDAKAVLEKSVARYVAAVEGKRGYE